MIKNAQKKSAAKSSKKKPAAKSAKKTPAAKSAKKTPAAKSAKKTPAAKSGKKKLAAGSLLKAAAKSAGPNRLTGPSRPSSQLPPDLRIDILNGHSQPVFSIFANGATPKGTLLANREYYFAHARQL